MSEPDELLETVAVHIKWLRRPNEVSNDPASYHADNRQSADYLERLVAVAIAFADKVEALREQCAMDDEGHRRVCGPAIEERDTLRAVIREDIEAEDEMHTLDREYDETVACDYDPASQMAALDSAIAARHRSADARKALRALVAPDPTSPTDTGDQA